MARFRYAACWQCRAKAQSVVGVTDKQQNGLSLGRAKGTNHRTGYKHRPESRQKTSESNKRFWANNPDKLTRRAAKTRAENHYRWKGGASKLNTSIRQMTENRKWMDAIKLRDGRCLRCGSTNDLESHHCKPLARLVEELGIKSREDARQYPSQLWDMSNGETLCRPCHYREHGRPLS